MSTTITNIRKDLKQNSDEKTKNSFQRFFKESVKGHGVKTGIVGKIGNKHFAALPDKSKKYAFGLCEELLDSGYIEEAFIAYSWVSSFYKEYEDKDLKTFKKWLDSYVSNWAECDTFCNHAVGSFMEKYPKYVEELKKWAVSKNRWVRRAAAVSLIIPAKKGAFLSDVFQISDLLLTDKDDLVQKGYGWLLKEASRLHQKEVFDYVMEHKKIMPRTALRYAIEKMPKELRTKAMARD